MVSTLERPQTATQTQSFSAEETPAAVFFPGQGLPPKDICSYYKLLSDINPNLVQNRLSLAQQTMDDTLRNSGFDIQKSLSDENSPDFKDTSFVQPVVYSLSVLAYEIMRPRFQERSIVPKVMAGHSLGEYSAITAAGAISFEEGIKIVSFRGKVMQEDCDKNPSRLIIIRELREDQILERLCQSQSSYCAIALINAPNLIVVGCAQSSVEEVVDLATKAGGQRVQKLDTAGAFHTRFMEEGAGKLDVFLGNYQFVDPDPPVIPNLIGVVSKSGAALRNNLPASMINPVRWDRTIQTTRELGTKFYVEAGPGSSMRALNVANGIPLEQSVDINYFFPGNF